MARHVGLAGDLMLARRLRPWAAYDGKRLMRAPKPRVRDSGSAHALPGLSGLPGLPGFDDAVGHPVAGGRWQDFVIEHLLAAAPPNATARFCRRVAGAEIDLLLEPPKRQRWAIGIIRSSAPPSAAASL